MNLRYLIENLAQNREVFRSLLAGLTPELYRWKPAPDKWCRAGTMPISTRR